jgi:hypothetical protein
MAGPRSYMPITLKRLFALSGNLCSFPGCIKTLVNHDNAQDSCICHIEGAKPGGERYNPNMTDAERADYKNLILLCPQHHAATNDVDKYTVEVLKKMKSDHESQYSSERLSKNPSMLKNVIYAISEINLQKDNEALSLNVFDISEKIFYNDLKENAEVVREYGVYQSKLNVLYDELELQGSIKKEKLLENIKIIYTHVKGRYIQNDKNAIDIVKSNSDNIFNDVYSELCQKLIGGSIFEEDVFIGLHIIMVDAFMRCKILEEPRPLHSVKKQSDQTTANYDSK